MTRTAIIRGARDRDQVAAYLPRNYRVVECDVEQRPGGRYDLIVKVEGEDVAGWTLDGYVLPRLASGLMFGTEVES